jgi:hypothetical protein
VAMLWRGRRRLAADSWRRSDTMVACSMQDVCSGRWWSVKRTSRFARRRCEMDKSRVDGGGGGVGVDEVRKELFADVAPSALDAPYCVHGQIRKSRSTSPLHVHMCDEGCGASDISFYKNAGIPNTIRLLKEPRLVCVTHHVPAS